MSESTPDDGRPRTHAPIAQRAQASSAATETGLKVKVDIDVVANRITDVFVDLDACTSVVTRGGTGEYALTPVLSVLSAIR